jgi:hypothetical protein
MRPGKRLSFIFVGAAENANINLSSLLLRLETFFLENSRSEAAFYVASDRWVGFFECVKPRFDT